MHHLGRGGGVSGRGDDAVDLIWKKIWRNSRNWIERKLETVVVF
jgi:hypothetical protein